MNREVNLFKYVFAAVFPLLLIAEISATVNRVVGHFIAIMISFSYVVFL